MPPVKVLVAVSSITVTLAYLLFRKCRLYRNLVIKPVNSSQTSESPNKSCDQSNCLDLASSPCITSSNTVSKELSASSCKPTNRTVEQSKPLPPPFCPEEVSENFPEARKSELLVETFIASSESENLVSRDSIQKKCESQTNVLPNVCFEADFVINHKNTNSPEEKLDSSQLNFQNQIPIHSTCDKPPMDIDPLKSQVAGESRVTSHHFKESSKNHEFEMAGTFLSGKLRHHSFPGSENVSPKVVTPETSCSSSCVPESIPSGCFNDPENDIVEDSPEMYFGKQIPRVLIPNDIWQQITDENVFTDTFCIPARMGGVLIGRFGKNVRELRSQWKAEFTLNMSPDNQDLLLFRIACPIEYKTEVLNWVNQRFKMRPSRTTIGNPNQLKRYLRFGQATPVQVRSSYGLKEMFVTIPDEKFARYLEMQREMDQDYCNYARQRMQLCEPVTSGTVAVLPHSQGFARALILKVFHVWMVKYALYYLLDHGVFGLIQINELRKIRAKYMRLPFQAIHVSWAHALPLFNDIPELHLLRTYFSSGQIHATAIRMETCCRASVVFTDLMVVSNQATQGTFSDPIPASVGQDLQAYPPLGHPDGIPDAELKMVDVLAMCCRAGLYTVAPLLLYPSRQCWLNQSDVPYFTYTGGDIDYQSYVSYILEDGSINSSPSPDGSKQQMLDEPKDHKSRKSKKRGKQSKTDSNSADEKENRSQATATVVAHTDNNNNKTTLPARPANNPWGKPVSVPEPPMAENAPAEQPSAQPCSKEEKSTPKLTMAQIVAMAPTPPPPKKPVQKAPVPNPPKSKSNSTSNSSSRASSKANKPSSSGKPSSRRPLKAKNTQASKNTQ